MTSERYLASVSQSWFKLSHSASDSKHKNIKKIHTLYYFPNKHSVECENLQHLHLGKLSVTNSIFLSGQCIKQRKETHYTHTYYQVTEKKGKEKNNISLVKTKYDDSSFNKFKNERAKHVEVLESEIQR